MIAIVPTIRAPHFESVQHFVDNRDGWQLSLRQTWDPAALRRDTKPVLIVPGYGMNSFIFGYHPGGNSFEAALVRAGLEVWLVDLRAQGDSRSTGGGDDYGLEDLALTDLEAAVGAALERTKTASTKVSVIGASLGATIMFAHAALSPSPRVGNLVSIGGPVRWVKIHPLLKLAFASPTLVGLIRLKGTRKLAELTLPHVLRHTPWLLSIYINPEHVDVAHVKEIVKTVEDPNRSINRQIARWINDRDLVLRGKNLSDAIGRVDVPLLCVVANADGIVPRETAEFCHSRVASTDKALLEVGSSDMRLAHADMFISRHAEDVVFAPIRDWLLAR
ncbi:MAG: alpha/beta fold hydrolase [Polyangiaceae bacterium]|nr:alpha/beta fold hydrolase [Polyangiaceae bacterium]